SLTTSQVTNLLATQIGVFTTNQIASLTPDQIEVLSTFQISALTSNQIANLTVDQVPSLTTTQLQTLKSSRIAALTTSQVISLTTNQVANLLPIQIGVFTTSQIASLTPDQVEVLNTSQFAALTPTQLQALTASQIATGLTTTQVVNLTTNELSALTTAQIAALTMTEIVALSTTQIAALSTSQQAVLPIQYQTPIMLDLTGGGINTLSISSGVQFDLNATGQKINTGWVGQGNGLLVLDINHDGVVNNGTELFGSATVLDDGQKAANGYDALTALDTNGDGVISNADNRFADLKVWIDSDADGVSQVSELATLDQLGITSLNLSAAATSEENNGNLVGLVSSYTTADGVTRAMADVWFATDNTQSAVTAQTVNEDSPSLQTQVSALTQAMSSFDDSTLDAVNNAAGSITAALSCPTLQSMNQPVSVNVSQLVDALNQFEASGSLVANPLQASSPMTGITGTSLLINDPAKTGFLAS
ncbi:MAG: hypothetical protein ACXV8S_07835, partial [Methylobacter sp.]